MTGDDAPEVSNVQRPTGRTTLTPTKRRRTLEGFPDPTH
jgi:hypothetical protein